ncbi:glycoside hydrolase family 65 [Paenibacillus sp. IB182496]|uniref:Glycoside hydrolase family 65 n=1 Tax=Paenibacillus sabuli TaxID=2772509 RepID=A0A927BTN1_9BACL|nr:glycoside hydrolase family 65 [Paenibacillus sabuli]MBD2845691.1 glycoside hydrolase family 65 [Paenibacillus sabuli]
MTIDRYQLVARNNPVLAEADCFAPLTVGNGEFAFTTDVTGLQTFAESYEAAIPLCTMSNWGWHTLPLPKEDVRSIQPELFDTYGRPVGYFSSAEGQETIFHWLRENPHRYHLGRIGFEFDMPGGAPAQLEDLQVVDQTLDMWTGTIKSRFVILDEPVEVETRCHPAEDVIAVQVRSPLVAQGRIRLAYRFPYGSGTINGADWEAPERHHTTITARTARSVKWARVLDQDRYEVEAACSAPFTVKEMAPHHYGIAVDADSDTFEWTTRFAPQPARRELPSCGAVAAAAARHWQDFWMTGGAIELADSRDPRAAELERRIVRSQYLTAIQCAGSIPPQETGLTCNSWYGKAHLEMHWWHAAQFALWGRVELLENSLGWYKAILPKAEANARRQGYAGVRWPKMVGPDGADSPSHIATLLIWQQPHPIFYAELCYRAKPGPDTLEAHREIVLRTAEFMASFAQWDAQGERYVLGPPVIPAQENHAPTDTLNPTYELEYWAQGLALAQTWRERLGLTRDEAWDRILSRLSPLPVRDGVYLAHERCPDTYEAFNQDHPSMLNAYGVLPGRLVEVETMRRTLAKVLESWDMPHTWGWDYPVMAMTAARLGEPETAIRCLLLDTPKNVYFPNGHNFQREGLPLYLPGNGGLLAAVAMMAAGWDDGPEAPAPGFPTDGEWVVRYEGLQRYM